MIFLAWVHHVFDRHISAVRDPFRHKRLSDAWCRSEKHQRGMASHETRLRVWITGRGGQESGPRNIYA